MEQAPLQLKRLRELEAEKENISHMNKNEEENQERLKNMVNKRQRSMLDIISLLEGDDEQEEPDQEISSIITTLQQEISSPPQLSMSNDHCALLNTEEDEREKEMRHLLEASDDELGIPSSAPTVVDEEGAFFMDGRDHEFLGMDGGDHEFLGLWEIEDEAANYYALIQAELFM